MSGHVYCQYYTLINSRVSYMVNEVLQKSVEDVIGLKSLLHLLIKPPVYVSSCWYRRLKQNKYIDFILKLKLGNVFISIDPSELMMKVSFILLLELVVQTSLHSHHKIEQ